MLILGLDTAISETSLAILEDGRVRALDHAVDAQPTSDGLLRRLEDLLARERLAVADFGAFASTTGPGSFTGLRIGLGVAKAFAWAREKPVYGFDRLQLAAADILATAAPKTPFTVVVRGMKTDLYAGGFADENGEPRRIGDDGFFANAALLHEHWRGPAPIHLPRSIAGEGPAWNDSASSAVAAAKTALRWIQAGRRPAPGDVQAHYLKPISIGGHSPLWKIDG